MAVTISAPASSPPPVLLEALQPEDLLGDLQLQAATADNPLLAASLTQTDTVSIFLPLIMNNQWIRPACSPDSPFGLQIADWSEVERDWAALQALIDEGTLLERLEESGACWSRVTVNWERIQPQPLEEGQPPSYRWDFYDENLTLVSQTGVRLIATVVHVPDWALTGPCPGPSCEPIRQDRLDDFGQFLTDLVNRYKEPPFGVRTWELFNEPDGVLYDPAGWGYNGDQYAAMLEVAHTAIKSADPTATVLMGGVAHDYFTENYPVSPPNGKFYRYFPDDVMANGGAAYLDVINFHYFHDFFGEWERWDPNSQDRLNGWLPAPTCGDLFDGQGTEYWAGGIDLIAKTNHFRNRLSTCFGVNKPVWVTELADHGYEDDPASMLQQARYVIQGPVRGLAAGVERIVWYALLTTDTTADQDLLFDDLTPKPAYYAYQTLTSQLEGYKYLRTLGVQNAEGYVFRNALGQEKTVAWSRGTAGTSATLPFTQTSQLQVADRSGKVTLIQDGGAGDADGVVNGTVLVRLPTVPLDTDPAHPRLSAEPYFISK
jgi:hypothetical protein